MIELDSDSLRDIREVVTWAIGEAYWILRIHHHCPDPCPAKQEAQHITKQAEKVLEAIDQALLKE